MHALDRRSDSDLAREIDRAITIEHLEGSLKAWSHLVQLGLSPNAIRRVLALDHGAQRRRRAAMPCAEASF
jgi:hypothetical protein